jgi:hypothetical protein
VSKDNSGNIIPAVNGVHNGHATSFALAHFHSSKQMRAEGDPVNHLQVRALVSFTVSAKSDTPVTAIPDLDLNSWQLGMKVYDADIMTVCPCPLLNAGTSVNCTSAHKLSSHSEMIMEGPLLQMLTAAGFKVVDVDSLSPSVCCFVNKTNIFRGRGRRHNKPTVLLREKGF